MFHPNCATHLTIPPPLPLRVPVLVDFDRAPMLFVRVFIGRAGVVHLPQELEWKLALLGVLCTFVYLDE